MLIIGLTGGIGSGKSTVAHHFVTLEVPVIDADIITRELVTPGQPALDEIAQQFGPEFILPSGELDRARLRQYVFDNDAERAKLEAILHPLAHREAKQRIARVESTTPQPAYLILCVPLLIESGWTDLVDRILVVDSSRENQLLRTQKRDGMSMNEINHIIDSQIDRQTRLDHADDIIQNDGDLTNLLQQVETLHKQYLHLAHTA